MKKDYKTIRRHPRDRYFVNRVMDLIDGAGKEIIIVTGEFSIYYFPGVRESLRRAINKGISVKAYLGQCDIDTINHSIISGITVYHGNEFPPDHDHYMVVDKKHVLISKHHEPYGYGRHGPLYENKEKIAEEMIKRFHSLTRRIKPSRRTINYRPRAEKFVEELFA